MGVLYSILPVNSESRSWLQEMGVTPSDADSRNPLIGEIYDVLNQLDGFCYEADEVKIDDSWDAQISDTDPTPKEWTRLTILKCRPPTEPQEFHFSKGSPELIIRIVAALANRCGELILSADGEDSFLIRPNSDPSRLYREWLATQQSTNAEQD